MNDRKMNESPKTIKSETESDSEPENSDIKITFKTEGPEIKSEPEWPCSTDSEHDGQIEPNFKIEKSEYEFQSSYLNWTENKDDDTVYYDDDSNYDDDDDDDDFSLGERAKNKNQDVAKKPKATRKRIRKFRNASLKERYTQFHEKRKYLDSFMLRSCPYCSKEFDSFTSWNAHLDDVHNHNKVEESHFTFTDNGSKAKCTECKTTLFFKVDTLKSHILVHLPHRNIYKCKICSLTKLRQFAMLLHIESRHFDVVGEALSALKNKDTKVCPYCGKYVGNLQMVAMHIKREHAEIYEQKLWYMCPFCNEQFAEEKCHKEHLLNKHQFYTLEGLSFETIGEQETNDGKQKYRCLKCNANLSGKFFKVSLHAITHLPYKCFKCRFCDYTHDRKWKVIKHTCKDLLIDIKNNPLLTVKTKSSKSRRSKSNFDGINTLFVCPKCGETFEEQSLWEAHQIKVHNFDDLECLNFKTSSEDGKTVVTCTICERKFMKCNNYNLKTHAFVHMPYKLYKCKLCETPLNSMIPCFCQLQNNASFLYICPQCGKEYNSQTTWNRHTLKEHDLRKPSGLGFSKMSVNKNEAAIYNCSDCGEVIKESQPFYLDLMFEHASIKHMPFKCYKCERCGDSSDSKDIMLAHTSNCKIVLKHMTAEDEAACSEIAKCQCHVCGYLGDSKEIVVTHLSEAHQLEIVENYIFTWFCTKCEFKYDTKEEILEHVLSIHLKKRPLLSKSNYICFFCPVCNTKFQTKPKWKAHLVEQHALNNDKIFNIESVGRDWKCLECNKIYKKSYSQKLSHYIKHLPYKSFKCIICGEAFNDLATARLHVSKCASEPKTMEMTEKLKDKKKRTKRPNIKKLKNNVSDTLSDPLQIDISNVQNYSPTSMAISTPKTPSWNKYCKYLTFACPECNMPFDTSEAWHMHISTHHDFFAEDRLNITTISETGNKPKQVCDVCGVTVYGSILHAQRHKLTHMPYQAFICKICKHRSKTNNVLMYHIERQHFTPGKFTCVICQVIFETCHDRFEHINAEHTDVEWPDKACRVCMKLFSHKYSLKEHMKKHDFNRETFECGFCKRKYYYVSERKKHWKQIHPVEYASMINEKQEELVVKKPVRKTKKYKKKKVDSEINEDFVSDSSSDSIVLSKIKQTKRDITKNTRTMEVKEEPQSEINNMETLLVKNEIESSDEIALARLIPNKNRITNKIQTNRKSKVRKEKTLFVKERKFKNEPKSDANDTDE